MSPGVQKHFPPSTPPVLYLRRSGCDFTNVVKWAHCPSSGTISHRLSSFRSALSAACRSVSATSNSRSASFTSIALPARSIDVARIFRCARSLDLGQVHNAACLQARPGRRTGRSAPCRRTRWPRVPRRRVSVPRRCARRGPPVPAELLDIRRAGLCAFLPRFSASASSFSAVTSSWPSLVFNCNACNFLAFVAVDDAAQAATVLPYHAGRLRRVAVGVIVDRMRITSCGRAGSCSTVRGSAAA